MIVVNGAIEVRTYIPAFIGTRKTENQEEEDLHRKPTNSSSTRAKARNS